MLSKLKCKIHVILILILLHKGSTGPCHQQKFGHDSGGLRIMIKSNITMLNSIIYVHNNHACYSCFIHSRMLIASYVHKQILRIIASMKSGPLLLLTSIYCYNRPAFVLDFFSPLHYKNMN